MLLQDAFQAFYETIELSSWSQERIDRAFNTLHQVLTAAYGVPDHAVFVQGSYANGTAVKPADPKGDYDVDIVVAGVAVGTAPQQALTDLRRTLESVRDYESKLEPDKPGRPCVRLRYADGPDGGFHIDVVPVVQIVPLVPAWRWEWPVAPAPLEAPMRGRESWRGTAPLHYTTWCLDQGDPFRRTVRMLKRWRAEHDAPISSILLQVLTAAAPVGASDAQGVHSALVYVSQQLEGHQKAPVIRNPVLHHEDLADRWEDSDFARFKTLVSEAADLADRAIRATSESDSHRLWQELFGSDFPPYSGPSGGVPPAPPGLRQTSQRPKTRVEHG